MPGTSSRRAPTEDPSDRARPGTGRVSRSEGRDGSIRNGDDLPHAGQRAATVCSGVAAAPKAPPGNNGSNIPSKFEI